MKYTISQEEFDKLITEAIDSALLPFIEQLKGLGVPLTTIDQALKNVVAKEMASDKSKQG